jgi:hypothetical protein
MGRTNRSQVLFEGLEARTYMSVAPAQVGATAGGTSNPSKLYRIPALLSQVIDALTSLTSLAQESSQSFFNTKKRLADPTPVVTVAAAVTGETANHKTVTLATNATYGGAGGNTALTYTWSAVTLPPGAMPVFSENGTNGAKSTSVTFDRAGTYTFSVSISDGVYTTTSDVTWTVTPVATRIAMSPASGTQSQLPTGGTKQFTASVLDEFDRPMLAPIAWTVDGVGSVTAGGLYQAPADVGTATVRASAGGIAAEASVLVSSGGAPVISTPAAAAGTVTGTVTTLSVLGADDGGEANLTYSWAVTAAPAGGAATFSVNGTNGAKNTVATFTKAGVYTFQVTVSDGAQVATSDVTVTVAQTLKAVAVSASAGNVALNQAAALTAVGYDQFGEALAAQPAWTWSKLSGVGAVSAGGVFTSAAAGTATLQAAATGVAGTTAVTVANAAPTVAAAAAAANGTVTGTSTTLSVLGADDGGEANLTYTWSTVSAPAGGAAAFSANGGNAAKQTGVTFTKAGTYTFKVTISDGTAATTSSVTVAVAATLGAIVVTPGSATLGLNGTTTLTAVAYDQFGAALAAQPAFAWGKPGGVGLLNVNGVFTAGGTAGTATIQASAGGVTGTTTVAVVNGAPTVATAPGAGGTVTGTTAALSVLGADDGGEAGLTYTWTTTGAPAGGAATFGANGTNAAKATTATFTKAGVYTFQVTISDGSLTTTSTATVTVAQALKTIVVTPASGNLSLNQTTTLAAVGYDQFGAALAAQPAFTWSKAGGVGAVTAGGAFSSPTAGSATVKATSGAVSGTATVAVANAAPTVAAAAAAGGGGTVGGLTTTLSALGADDGGEANLTYAWTATAAPAGAAPTFAANGTNAAKSTVVTFDKAGVYTFKVTVSDGSLTTTSSVTLTVAQTLTSIAVSPASAGVALNGTVTFAATGYDQFGAALAVQPGFSWSKVSGVGAVSAGGVFSAGGTAGAATVQAAAGGVAGTATVAVGNTAPVVVTAAAGGSGTVTGTTAALSVLGADDGGEANLTYSWAVTTAPAGGAATFSLNGTNGAKNTTATFTKAGAYTFQVTISDGALTTTSSVTLTVVQTLSTLSVSAGSASVVLNQSTALSAAGFDQFGAPMASLPAVTWNKVSGVGTVAANGTFSSAAAGSAVVQASAGGVTGTTTVAVQNAAPTVAVVAAAGSGTVAGTGTTLSVLGADDGGENGLTYTWTTAAAPAGGAATFSVNGTNGAKSTAVTFTKAGTYSFLVTIGDGTFTATSSVTVNVMQTLGSIVVTPGSATLSLNGSTTLSAVGYDQFGAALAAQPAFTWSKVGGVGSLSAGGVFAAGSTAGAATLQAAAGGVAGTAVVSVGNAAPTVAAAAGVGGTVTGTTAALSVLGADDGGEAGLTYTWSATAAPAGGAATFSVNGTNGAKATVATFTKAGTYTFKVTISDGTLTTTSSVTVNVSQTLTSVAVTPGATAVNLNGTVAFSATGFDQFGAALAVQPAFTWSKVSGVGSVSADGVLSAGATAGTAAVQAAAGGVAGTASVAVQNAAPTVQVVAAAGSGTVAGTGTTLSVLGADDAGETGLTYTWSTTAAPAGATPTFSVNGTNGAKATAVTFNKAGAYTFKVTISDGSLTTTSSVTLTVAQTLTSIAVTAASGSVTLNQTTALSAVAKDQFGAALTTQPAFTWSKVSGVGTVTAGGVFSATAAGAATLQAAVGGVVGTVGVTVTNAAPTVATGAAASGQTATQVTLSALGADDGGEAGLTYAWSTVSAPAGGAATFSVNGTNGAKGTTATFTRAGSYTFKVTISDGVNSTTSQVAVTVAAVATAVTVTPGAVTLAAGATQQYAAAVADQFGQPMAAAVTWTATGGAITAGGLFTAGGAAGAGTVRAAVGAAGGTAAVTVTAAAPAGNPVAVTTRNMTSFTELVITGTSGNDSIYVTQSGGTFTIVSNGTTQTITGTFGDLAIHAGNGGSTITVDASVTINTMVYGGQGADTIANRAAAGYVAVVTIGGGTDVVSGNGVNTNFWTDTADGVTASAAEAAGGYVHKVASFYQPWTTSTTSADYVPLELNGQNLKDPTDTGTVVRYSAGSLWGAAPSANDVRQGGIGDCYFLAGLQSVAFGNPQRLMTKAVDLGDGTYGVEMMKSGVKVVVRVDGDFSGWVSHPAASGNLWAVVFEKAFAYVRLGLNSYGSLDSGGNGEPFTALGLVQGSVYTSMINFDPNGFANQVKTDLAVGRALTMATGSSIGGGAPLIANHAYSIVGVESTPAGYVYVLRNPWGFDGAGNDGNTGDGVVRLTASQLRSNGFYLFEGYFV